MANETGDMKIVGNFRKLIDFVIGATLYVPTNGVLVIVDMETRLAAAIAGVEDIGVKMAPNKFAINARQTAYTDAIAIVRGSRNILKASGASVKTMEDADTFTRKIFGLRKSKKKTDDPNTPANEANQNYSASQQSYDAILGNINSYIEIVKGESLYNPNEAQYKTTTLDTMSDDLETKNNAVSTTFVPLNTARSLRDDLLYTGENCLCDVAALVKAYIKAIHGASSQIYKSINALSFRRSFR